MLTVMSGDRPGTPGAFQELAVPPRVHGALLLVQLLFGVFHVVGKAVLGEVPPLALAASRVLIAAPLLIVLAWWRDRLVPPLRELPVLALLGLLGVFANQILFIVGLSYTTASNAAILMPSIPVFAVALGALFGIQRVSRLQLLGVLSAVTGALVLLDPTRFSLADDTIFGNLLILANCLSYSAFLVFQRPVLLRLPWRTFIAWCFLLGGTGIVAVGAPALAALPLPEISRGTWLGVIYIGVLPTALGYFLAAWAVRRSSPALVSVYTTLQPLVTAVLAVLFLGERLGGRQAAGFALIAAGLAGVSRRR